eukprot:8354206-Alexandrium_andersonii.AAC.1
MPPWAGGPRAATHWRAYPTWRPSPSGRGFLTPRRGRAAAACSATASTWLGRRTSWTPRWLRSSSC